MARMIFQWVMYAWDIEPVSKPSAQNWCQFDHWLQTLDMKGYDEKKEKSECLIHQVLLVWQKQ